MPSPLPRRSGWTYTSLVSPCRISLPRKGCRVGLRVVLFEACSAFTHVAACTLARSPIRDPLSEGFSHFVTSMTAPVASGGSEIAGWAFHPLERCRLSTAHTLSGRSALLSVTPAHVPQPPFNAEGIRGRVASRRSLGVSGIASIGPYFCSGWIEGLSMRRRDYFSW